MEGMVWLLEMAEWLVQMPHVYQEVLDLVNSYQAAIVGDCCLLSAVPILHEKQIKGNFYNIGAGERERERHSLPAAGDTEPLVVGSPAKELVGGPPIISLLSESIVFRSKIFLEAHNSKICCNLV